MGSVLACLRGCICEAGVRVPRPVGDCPSSLGSLWHPTEVARPGARATPTVPLAGPQTAGATPRCSEEPGFARWQEGGSDLPWGPLSRGRPPGLLLLSSRRLGAGPWTTEWSPGPTQQPRAPRGPFCSSVPTSCLRNGSVLASCSFDGVAWSPAPQPTGERPSLAARPRSREVAREHRRGE